MPKIFSKQILNSKGFNLFSALVAAVFIMSSVVLVNMLVSTEEKISTEIYDMTNNFSLADAAALAKSDALQSFNYNFREQIEEYLALSPSEVENGTMFKIIQTDEIGDWDKILKNFEIAILKTGNTDGAGNPVEKWDAVITSISQKTIDQFHDGRYGRYHVSLSSRNNEAKQALKEGMMESTKNLSDSDPNFDFLKVVGCNGYDDCPLGTFYFIIPLDKMKNEQYEALPRIIVKDLVSGEEIQTPLLPKTRLNIYVPLRFFKAIYESQKNAEAIYDFEQTIGFDSAGLGYCDYGCEPRKDPLNRAGNKWTGHNCKGSGSDEEIQTLDQDYVGIGSYKITGSGIGGTALRAFAVQKICENWEGTTYENNDAQFINKTLDDGGYAGENTSNIENYPGCSFDKIYTTNQSEETKDLIGGASGNLHCTTLRQVTASALFEDTNPLYIVSGEKNFYRIGIRGKVFDLIQTNGECTSGENSNGTKMCQ